MERLPEEIVISDPTDGCLTLRVAGDVSQCSNVCPPIRVIRSPRKVLPFQRWFAFKHSKYELIWYLDDDVMVTPHCWGFIASHFEKDPKVVAAGGMSIVTPRRLSRLLDLRKWLQGRLLVSAGQVTHDGRCGGFPPWDGGSFEIGQVQFLSGCCMAYRRQVLEKIGALTEVFSLYEAGLGKAEDQILSCNASRVGRVLLDRRAIVYHPRHMTGTAYPSRGWRRGRRYAVSTAFVIRSLSACCRLYPLTWLRFVGVEAIWTLGRVLKGRLSELPALAGLVYGTGEVICRGSPPWKRRDVLHASSVRVPDGKPDHIEQG